MKNRGRLKKYSIFIAALLILSLAYRIFIFNDRVLVSDAEKKAAGRSIVTIGLKNSYYIGHIKEKVAQFNNTSKDAYIDLQVFKHDYYNLMKIMMLTKNKPDISQFSFYDHIKNGQLYNLNELNVNTKSVGDERTFYYKNIPMGVKIAGSTVKFVWNTDVFKACGLDPNRGPQTWQEVIEYSKRIKAKFPNMVPFEFPAGNFGDIRLSVGENSLDKKSIYTSFWDYRNGKYDFSSAKNILMMYKEMYNMGLLAKNFNTRDRITVRNDFIEGKTAMMISPYEDKVAFLTGAPINFIPGVSELPVLYNGQSRNYYYVEDINILVASKNAQNSEAVKKVYNWFINDALSSDNKFNILKYGTGRVAELDKYDKNDNFKYEKKDPTGSFDYNYTKVQELFCKVIDGTRNVDDVIKELNKYSIECMDKVIKVDTNYFKNYIDKE